MFFNYEKKRTNSLYYIDLNPNGFPSVLLLHGLGADGTSWTPQFRELISAGIRPIAPDIPGFGRSKHPNGRWTVDKVAAAIVDLLDNLDISMTDVVGLSMGGAVALSLALNHSKRVRRLILANTFACLRPRNLSQTIYFIRRLIISTLTGGYNQAELVARRIFPRQDQDELRLLLIKNIVETDPQIYRQAMISLGLYNVRRKLREINCPTLVISGQDDTTVAIQSQLELIHGIRDARHVVLPDAGHAVTIDQSDLFNREIINFLKESIMY